METKFNRIENFLSTLSECQIEEGSGMLLSISEELIGGSNGRDCDNYTAGACNSTNIGSCTNNGVCDKSNNTGACKNLPAPEPPSPVNPSNCQTPPPTPAN